MCATCGLVSEKGHREKLWPRSLGSECVTKGKFELMGATTQAENLWAAIDFFCLDEYGHECETFFWCA